MSKPDLIPLRHLYVIINLPKDYIDLVKKIHIEDQNTAVSCV